MIMFSNANKPILVITALTRWDEPPRMRHYVATYLAQYFNVIFCELNQRGFPQVVHINSALVVLKIGMYVPGISRLKLTDKAFNRFQAYAICKYLKNKCKDRLLILLNFKYDFIDIYCNQTFCIKYLFINDDFINMNPNDTQTVRESKQRAQSLVINKCDRVFVSSDPLADDIKNHHTPVSIIYSGHDFDPMHNLERDCAAEIGVCFMGYIHDKLELTWLEMLANRPEVKIVLIGPVESNRVRLALSKFGNVFFHPPMVGRALQEYMSIFDVFIMPYTIEPVNSKATIPAKLFQYLACGKPVVSSVLSNLVALPEGFIYFASDAAEFVDQVFKAKELDTVHLAKLRINYAMDNGWDKRANQIYEIVKADIEKRGFL